MKVSLLWGFSFLLITVFFIIFVLVKKETNFCKNSNSQFECGFSMMNPSQIPFSFQFFLISLLFLIFDIEIVLIISYPLEVKTIKTLLVLFLFLLFLALGLLYEWQKSKLNWSK